MPLPLPTIEVSSRPSPRVGLLTAAVGPMDFSDVHVTTAGAQYEAEACTDARFYPTACLDVPYEAFVYDAREQMRRVYAFNVYASEVCTPVGTSVREAHARVNRRLQLGEQTAVEAMLWGGGGTLTGIFEQMQAGGLVTAVAGTAGPIESLSLLEQTGSGLYDGRMNIHARPRMAAYFANRGLIYTGARRTGEKPDLSYTHFGSEYVFGAGYKGSSPAGAVPDATTETIYATGRILVWRSDIVSPGEGQMSADPLLNRTTNQRSVFALRTYALAVECFAAAVTVTRGAAT